MSLTFSAEKVVSAERGAFWHDSVRSANFLTSKSAVAVAAVILGQGLKLFVYLYIEPTFSSASVCRAAFAVEECGGRLMTDEEGALPC